MKLIFGFRKTLGERFWADASTVSQGRSAWRASSEKFEGGPGSPSDRKGDNTQNLDLAPFAFFIRRGDFSFRETFRIT